MSRIGQVLARGISALNSGLGNPTLTWSGNTYSCVPHQSDLSKTLESGGLVPSSNQSFVIPLSELGDLRPAAMEFITYGADQFQIERVKVSQDGSHVILDCVDPDRGA
jgi:hypothetical protein